MVCEAPFGVIAGRGFCILFDLRKDIKTSFFSKIAHCASRRMWLYFLVDKERVPSCRAGARLTKAEETKGKILQ